jgi:hypothetical protein
MRRPFAALSQKLKAHRFAIPAGVDPAGASALAGAAAISPPNDSTPAAFSVV